jgi:predicted dehydrogenase
LERLRIGIVGVGKVAREQHIPVLRTNPAFDLIASVSGSAVVEGLLNYATIEEMFASVADLDAVAICSPPQTHYGSAKQALMRRKHVLLEKPPCATTAEFDHLVHLARTNGCTLFQTWHARHSAAVDHAKRWLAAHAIRGGRIVWKEDVRFWHPRQAWIWKTGGFGVLDAGINAISILTKVSPEPIFVDAAQLFYPANCDCPIAANVVFRTESDARLEAEFDFRYNDKQHCSIVIETEAEPLRLERYGTELSIGGAPVPTAIPEKDYSSLYGRFAELIAARESETDKLPFQLVADIFLLAKRSLTDPFEE